jgi:hypothetical protein
MKKWRLLCVWGVSLVAGAGHAQMALANDPMGQIPVLDRRFSDFSPAGFQLGLFNVLPSLDTSISHTTNALQANSNEQSDRVLTATGAINALADTGRSKIQLNGEVQQIEYQELSDLNRLNFNAGVGVDYDLSGVAGLRFEATADRSHETRFENPVEQSLFEPIQIDSYGFLSELILRPAQTQWIFSAQYQDIAYEDTNLIGPNTVSVQKDRDRSVYSGGVRVSYERFGDKYKQRLVPFFGFNLAKSSYKRGRFEVGTGDFTGVKQDSTTYNAVAGIDIKPTGKLSGVASVGYSSDKPDAASLESQDDFTVNIDLAYLYSPLTNFTFSVDRFFSGNTGDSSVALQTQLSGRVIHELTRQWIFNAGVDYLTTDYANDLSDSTWTGLAGFDYRINRNFVVGGDVRYISRESDRANGDYDETRAMIRLKSSF